MIGSFVAAVTTTTTIPPLTIVNNIPKSAGPSPWPTIVTAIASIAAVGIGGLVTYFATTRLESRRVQREDIQRAEDRAVERTERIEQTERETLLRAQRALSELPAVALALPEMTYAVF